MEGVPSCKSSHSEVMTKEIFIYYIFNVLLEMKIYFANSLEELKKTIKIMAYIQFLSEELSSKEQIYLDIMLTAYNLKDIESILCRYRETFTITKKYLINNEKLEENIFFLEQDIDTYFEYLKYPDEENPCVVLNFDDKRLISLFSADKVIDKNIVFDFAKEYLKIRPTNYLLIDQIDLYDLERLEKMI